VNLAMANTNFFIVRNGLQVGNTAVMDSNGFWVNPNRLTISNTSVSTSNVTGALVVSGGVGIKGAQYVDNIYLYGSLYNASSGVAYQFGGSSDPGQSLFFASLVSGGDL